MKGLYTPHDPTYLGVPQQTAAQFPALSDLKSEPMNVSLAKLGGTAELFGPFYVGNGWLFFNSKNKGELSWQRTRN